MISSKRPGWLSVAGLLEREEVTRVKDELMALGAEDVLITEVFDSAI